MATELSASLMLETDEKYSEVVSVNVLVLDKLDIELRNAAAIEIASQTDYSIKVSLDEAKSGGAKRRVRVYADGIYDMFHSGHARQMMQIKQMVPYAYLIVGVTSDETALKYKGRTVMAEAERYEAVRHCRYVDEVIRDPPWLTHQDFVTKHKIDLVAHDDLPYVSAGSEDLYATLKSKGIFLATQRTEGISTTDIIARIIKDYDVYVRRNLSKGCSHSELNVGYLQTKRIEVAGKFSAWKAIGRDILTCCMEMSHEWVQNFIHLFTSPTVTLNNWMSKGNNISQKELSYLDHRTMETKTESDNNNNCRKRNGSS